MSKTSPNRMRVKIANRRNRLRRRYAIGMEKPQPFAARDLRAAIHLKRTTAFARHILRSKFERQSATFGGRPAVGDDDLILIGMSAISQRSQTSPQRMGIVQDGNHRADAGSQTARSANAIIFSAASARSSAISVGSSMPGLRCVENGLATATVRQPARRPHSISESWSPTIQLRTRSIPNSSRASNKNCGFGFRQRHAPEYGGTMPSGWW